VNDRILVLGATGTVGGHLVERLGTRGLTVRAATRRYEQARARNWRVEWARLDLERPETFAPALDGVRSVFMIARPGDEHADEVGLPFVRAMRAAGVRHVVNLTAMGTEVAGHVPALRRIELALEESGMAFTHLRPNFFMQIFSTPPLQLAIRGDGALRLPAGDAKLSLIDARDIAAVAEAALTSPAHHNRAYTLTGDEAIDHAAVARQIGETVGRPVRYDALDEATAAHELAAAGFPTARIERLARFYRLVRSGACAPVSPDVRSVLGRPALTFAQFARDHRSAWS
jgi:uncharacterized protein YbjT (DUF2867 family)